MAVGTVSEAVVCVEPEVAVGTVSETVVGVEP